MAKQQPKTQSAAWAWAAGWFLASMGLVLSDVYSRPNRGLTAAYLMGFAGWTVGAAGAIRHIRQRFGADVPVVALSVIGWGAGALVAVGLGLSWLEDSNLRFWGPILSTALGGAIGGALTQPRRSLASPATVLLRSVSGAVRWGATFLVFQVVAFYTGYILVEMTVDPLVPLIGHSWAKVPGWALPSGLCGYFATRVALRHSHLNEQGLAV